jgi:hypothetical protein
MLSIPDGLDAFKMHYVRLPSVRKQCLDSHAALALALYLYVGASMPFTVLTLLLNCTPQSVGIVMLGRHTQHQHTCVRYV